ncbi:hypothetical protein [Dyella tabacisoli]|uniref:hypothetical protein n=1 Tax=Dyella tabacisoli TaxID=2282381 RepID=UPI0017853D7C|nr:hypothetical protein [Dyella tabacisoli]
MSSVIDFLERMGKDAQLRHASHDEVELALTQAQIDTPLCSAILARDASELQALLRQVPFYSIQMPIEEEEEDEGEHEDEDTEEAPPYEGSRETSRHAVSLTHS